MLVFPVSTARRLMLSAVVAGRCVVALALLGAFPTDRSPARSAAFD